MAGTEGFGNVAVILAALILVADQQGNWRAGRLALENTGKNLHSIRLTALRHMSGSAGFSPVQLLLDVCRLQCQARWAAVDNTADPLTMRLAKGSDCK
jgi:hypothetical protein